MAAFVRITVFLAAAAATVAGLLTSASQGSAIHGLVVGLLVAVIGAWIATAVVLTRAREERERAVSGAVNKVVARLAELETERSRVAAMLAGMVEGVLVVDADGRLRLINDTVRRMLNLEHIPLGSHYVEAVRQPGVVQQLGGALKGEQQAPIEVALDLPGGVAGAPRIFRAQATPVSHGVGGGAVLVLHEITDLRRADRVRRDFVANVSHELRTPLTAVRGYVEALMDEPTSPDQRRKFLEIIERHTGRMERLVRDLLRLARLDAQQEAADVHLIEVGGLFRSVLADLAGKIEQQKITVVIDIDPGSAVVQADPTKMHDALRNLVENALNYSPEGGRVDLAVRASGDSVLLTVSDTGPGIPEADLGRVFERFYRVDKSRTSDPGGTGLGLSIVRHLIELQGGRVHAANRPEGGAVFTISLRSSKPAAESVVGDRPPVV
jgi:two-component system phosphate regulon sensor histidine kinase PhoR